MGHLEELREKYLDQPHEVSLETFAFCNAACTFCPYPILERKGEKMPDALIARLIDEMAEWREPFFFSPFKVNEPLLDKRLVDICRKVEDNTLGINRIFTNGAALTPSKIDELSSLNRVLHLWVSLNSHDPDEYRALMNLDFEKTAKRLDFLHESEFPFPVMLSTVGFPNEEFRYYCFERWPRFESVAIQRSEWLGYTTSQVDVVPDTPCGRWFELSIMASGIVSLCCMDGEGQFPIGDVNENTLLEVYNAPEWRERRDKLLSRHDVHPCSTCTY